ncbi:MAG: hypothetical protein Fur0010_04520 [Bdellovibrio sp.]
MNKTIKNLVSVSMLLTVTNAWALPTLYPTEVTLLSTIQNKTNSNLVADSVDSHVIYVMPPNSAYSYVEGLHTLNANLGMCREIRDLQTYGRRLTQRIADISEKAEERQKIKEKKLEDLKNAKLKLADYVVANSIQEISSLEDAITENQKLIIRVSDQIQSCEQNCDMLNTEYKDLRKIRRELLERKHALQDSYGEKYEKFLKQQKKVEALQADYDTIQEEWENLTSSLLKLRNDFHEMYKKYGELEGASAAVRFTSQWDQNIDSLRELNPGFDFKKIPTQNAVITSNITDLKYIPSGSAILGYRIGGDYQEGHIKMPAYPENLSGNVVLSLLGACPVLHPGDFDINIPSGSDRMRYGLTVAYEYPSAFTTRVRMTYNMHKIYQKIVSSGSRGGFFRRRSWTSVEERTYFQDSFKVDWLEQDASNRLTAEQKEEMEQEMRNRIFARLAAIGLPAAANAGQLVLPSLNASGAIVLSGALKKHCPGNAYCIAGSVALDVLDSIFGSSFASASYTNVQNADMSEEWSQTIVSFKPWVTSYN